ncbi:polymer-forming cytoskeletal protein [Shewanella sp. D64]|uniref:polymer-forming cytoskeletal protein n=1 Tax=unclassified Shewanella TaxID=196818 RepID=UPI0022BA6600|nr:MULTISPECIES: polymer-forming cytoskeletal protein [unclassified Shewanella]MEC4725454.1 polymer-forming cytoskeletal protein [Shewanella sp. D64]MEC4738727.1 polymer-forming cytoskeletal protein [Shewanella sp. E94]WBJ95021.1 polymer-forming cytoskeletal protein [Shewanella sp. MTB7]
MIRKTLINVLFLFLFISLTLPVRAFDDIDLHITFPAVAQGHHETSNYQCSGAGAYSKQLEQKHNAKINGTEGLDLNFCSSSEGHKDWPSDGCDTGNGGARNCSITGRDIAGISLTGANAFKEANSNVEIECCPGGSINLGTNGNSEFEEIKIDDECVITFSTAYQEYRIESLELKSGGELIFPSGDYWIEEIENEGKDLIIRPQGKVRIFIGEKHAHLKDFTIAENLTGVTTLVVYDHLELKGNSVVNALIYADVHITLKDNAVVIGRVTSGRLKMEKNSIINASNISPQKFDFKFGKATSNSVTFDSAFDSDVTPLIFLMPTVSTNNPYSNDGPASVFITQVSNRGFTWSQKEPDSSSYRYKPSLKMPELHWISTTIGEHKLSDGSYLKAGVVEVKEPLYQNSGSYQRVTNRRNYDVVLNQIQTTANRCWLTSTTKWDQNNVFIGIDVSEVVDAGPGLGYGNKYCQPGDIKLNKLNKEKVGYLALQSGDGTISVAGEQIQYQFGSNFSTTNEDHVVDLNQQCGYTRSLLGFSNPPTFVAGKSSRAGNNGGWLRRCLLTNDTVSMVTDEDRYQNVERDHIAERYGFVALELIDDVSALNHYRIHFSSGALSCAAKDITIQACNNDNCSTQSAQISTVELTKNGVKYSDVSFTGHTDPATELWHAAGGSFEWA